jgi:hypothetical protein
LASKRRDDFDKKNKESSTARPKTIARAVLVSRNSRDLDLLLQLKPQVAALFLRQELKNGRPRSDTAVDQCVRVLRSTACESGNRKKG